MWGVTSARRRPHCLGAVALVRYCGPQGLGFPLVCCKLFRFSPTWWQWSHSRSILGGTWCHIWMWWGSGLGDPWRSALILSDCQRRCIRCGYGAGRLRLLVVHFLVVWVVGASVQVAVLSEGLLRSGPDVHSLWRRTVVGTSGRGMRLVRVRWWNNLRRFPLFAWTGLIILWKCVRRQFSWLYRGWWKYFTLQKGQWQCSW